MTKYPTLTRDTIDLGHSIIYIQPPDKDYATSVLILRDADVADMGWRYIQAEVTKECQRRRIPVTNCTIWGERC